MLKWLFLLCLCLVGTALAQTVDSERCLQKYPSLDKIVKDEPKIYEGISSCLNLDDTEYLDNIVGKDFGLQSFKDTFETYHDDDPEKLIPFTSDPGSKITVRLDQVRIRNDPSAFNLKNWMALVVEPKNANTISKLMIESVTSPVGLPYVEFRPDIKCTNTESLTSPEPGGNLEKAIPCRYVPRSAIRNPNFYVIVGQSFTRVATLFNWIDVLCHEVTAIQFSILVDFGGGTTEAYLTPVYKLKAGERSKIGIPFPYHLSFNVTCGDKGGSERCTSVQCPTTTLGVKATSDIVESITNMRIIPNQDYHDCVRNQGSGTITDPKKATEECPPGPFRCSEDRAKAAKDNKAILGIPNIASEADEIAYRKAVSKTWTACPYVKNSPEKFLCKKIAVDKVNEAREKAFPKSARSTLHGRSPAIQARAPAPDPLRYEEPNREDAYRLIKNLTISQRVIDRSEHGALMIAAFFVVMSGSNYLARFFKETGGESEATENGCCGYRCWLLIHMALSFISLYLIWMSLTMPMDTLHCQQYRDKYDITECVKNPTSNVTIHVKGGYLLIFFAHINFAFGWIRPLNRKLRKLFTAIHSVAGHILQFLVLTIIFFTKVCKDVLAFVIILMALGFVISGVSTYLQLRKDQKIKLEPKRKLFPIAEHVSSQDCKIGYIGQLWVHWLSHTIVYMLILFCYKVYINEEHCWLSSS